MSPCVVINGAVLSIKEGAEITEEDRAILSDFIDFVRKESDKRRSKFTPKEPQKKKTSKR